MLLDFLRFRSWKLVVVWWGLTLNHACAGLLYIHDDLNRLGTVDIDTGAVTVIGTLGLNPAIEPFSDIAFDPHGQLYGVTFNLNQGGQSYLYAIDHHTAEITLSRSLGAGVIGQNALVFHSKGYMLNAGAVNGNLYFTHSLPAAPTVSLGNTGFTSAGDLAFRGGALYLASKTFFPETPDRLVRIDWNTASVVGAEVVGEIGFNNVFGLATGNDGVLYGVTGTRIIAINPTTGAGTFVRDYAGHGLGAAQGTAFFSEAGAIDNAVPEPSSLALVGMALAGGCLPWMRLRRTRNRTDRLRSVNWPSWRNPMPLFNRTVGCAGWIVAISFVAGCCDPECEPGQTCCGFGCVDLSADSQNCGACGNTCPKGTSCVGGECVTPSDCNPACSPNETCCDGDCVDLATNIQNCGACGNVCPEGTVCSGGACVGMRKARKK